MTKEEMIDLIIELLNPMINERLSEIHVTNRINEAYSLSIKLADKMKEG